MSDCRVFVYGTLRRGLSNHDRFMYGFEYLGEASLPGRLWVHADGIPVMLIPPGEILDYGAEGLERFLQAYSAEEQVRAGTWGTVHGELYALPDHPVQLARLDQLEEFHPPARTWYHRVAVEVRTDAGRVPAWTYVAAPWEADARELADGVYRQGVG